MCAAVVVGVFNWLSRLSAGALMFLIMVMMIPKLIISRQAGKCERKKKAQTRIRHVPCGSATDMRAGLSVLHDSSKYDMDNNNYYHIGN